MQQSIPRRKPPPRYPALRRSTPPNCVSAFPRKKRSPRILWPPVREAMRRSLGRSPHFRQIEPRRPYLPAAKPGALPASPRERIEAPHRWMVPVLYLPVSRAMDLPQCPAPARSPRSWSPSASSSIGAKGFALQRRSFLAGALRTGRLAPLLRGLGSDLPIFNAQFNQVVSQLARLDQGVGN